MPKRTLIVLSIFALCVPAFGSRPLTNNEVLDILQTLTASPMKTWIPAGTIQATHTEYRAPKTTDTDIIYSRITRDLLVAAAEHATAMRVIDDPAARLSRQRVYRMQVEAMAHNVRYELANESNMQSLVIIKYDGNRFYWEINVATRSDTITTPADLVSNGYARRFDLDWNQKRVFVWDGENYINYFRPGNHAIITHERGNVNGPLTAGIVPWGYGVYTYANLSTLPLSGIEMDSGDIELTATDTEWQDIFILDPAQNYALKSRTRTAGNYVTYVTYGNHTLLGGRFCPTSIVIEEYDMTGGGNTLASSDIWNIASITDQAPASEEFAIDYELDALIEDYPVGGDRLMYRYAPPMPPEAKNINTDDLLSEHAAIARKENDSYRNCATVALKYVANRLGTPLTLKDASRMVGPAETGVSLAALQTAAEELGLHTLPVTTNIGTLAENRNTEAILHLPENDHYVVLGGIDDKFVMLIDIASDCLYYRQRTVSFEKLWDGTALLLANKPIADISSFAVLNGETLATIRGTATCKKCKDPPIQNREILSSCTEIAGDCSGSYIMTLERHECKYTGKANDSCRMESIAAKIESLCGDSLESMGSCVPNFDWEVMEWIDACDDPNSGIPQDPNEL